MRGSSTTYRRSTAKLKEQLGGKCALCPEADPEKLEFDHPYGRDWEPCKLSSGSRIARYKREAAAKYAFLLAIPAVVGSGFFKLFDISSDPVEPAWGPIILATVVAFFVGLAVIHWLLRYISTHNFLPFVIYRLVLGIALLGVAISGWR